MPFAQPLTFDERARAADLWSTLPPSWQGRLMASRGRKTPTRPAARDDDRLLSRVLALADCARAGIRPDASDAEICAQADLTARDFARRLRAVEAVVRGQGKAAKWTVSKVQAARLVFEPAPAGKVRESTPEHAQAVAVRLQSFYARELLRQRGLLDLWPGKRTDTDRRPALKRMQCARWWRRTYRKLHARTVEACAIDLGLVRRTAGLYASDEAVQRRAAQNARNALALESVTAVNDLGQDFTLAELAAKGTANKAIRRVELLTRIAGFELIAKACGHVGYMITVSCPSRFHRTTTLKDGRVVDNPRWDRSTPADAQRYLSAQWAKCRAAAARRGLEWYGFRIAEPQQDGTPHWHSLLFMPAGTAYRQAVRLIRRYFWRNDNPNERGAKKHRVDFERIDWSKGSAVGYVIKYVSKNIDGHGVGLDLFGNDAITSSQRVEAWASSWRIRQFQQIGGAPVGVWRELRRVHPDQLAREDGPQVLPAGWHPPLAVIEPLRAALVAVNVAKTEPGVQAIAWRRYIELQGGTACRRKFLRVKLHKVQTGEIGRYGEVMPARPVGVVAEGVEFFRNHIHQMDPTHPPFQRRSAWALESERAEWIVVQGAQAVERAKRDFKQGEAAQPRIHVNNCTDPTYARSSEWAPRTRFLPKLRRFVRRDPPPGRPPGIQPPAIQ